MNPLFFGKKMKNFLPFVKLNCHDNFHRVVFSFGIQYLLKSFNTSKQAFDHLSIRKNFSVNNVANYLSLSVQKTLTTSPNKISTYLFDLLKNLQRWPPANYS